MKACTSIGSRFPWYLITSTEFAGRELYSSQQSCPTRDAEVNIPETSGKTVQVGPRTLYKYYPMVMV